MQYYAQILWKLCTELTKCWLQPHIYRQSDICHLISSKKANKCISQNVSFCFLFYSLILQRFAVIFLFWNVLRNYLCGFAGKNSWRISWHLCTIYCVPHFQSLTLSACSSQAVYGCAIYQNIYHSHDFKLQKAALFPPLQGGDVSDISLSTVFWCYAKSVTCKQCAFRMEVIHFFPLKYKHQDNTREKKKRFVPYLKISVSKKEMAIGLWFLSLSAQWGLWAPEFLLWMDPQTTIDLSPCLHFHPLVHLWVAAFSLEKRLKEQKK